MLQHAERATCCVLHIVARCMLHVEDVAGCVLHRLAVAVPFISAARVPKQSARGGGQQRSGMRGCNGAVAVLESREMLDNDDAASDTASSNGDQRLTPTSLSRTSSSRRRSLTLETPSGSGPVKVYTCARTHTYLHTRAHAHTHTHSRTHTFTHAHTLSLTHANTQARTHSRTHARTHARAGAYARKLALTLTHARTGFALQPGGPRGLRESRQDGVEGPAAGRGLKHQQVAADARAGRPAGGLDP
jgi:hypothetical protein